MGRGYEPTALRCDACGHVLLTPARLFGESDRKCPMCEGDMARIEHASAGVEGESPWD